MHRLVVRAPRVATVRQPGQFVIVRQGPGAERIPLTIADSDLTGGSIVLFIQRVGKSTSDLVALAPGDNIHDIARPPSVSQRRPQGWNRRREPEGQRIRFSGHPSPTGAARR
jgi:hypothetical protein